MHEIGSLSDAVEATKPRILCIDIETRPIVAHVWGLHDQTVGISQILDPGGVICWAAQWWGQKPVMFASDFHDGHDEMVFEAWRLLDAADIVVGWNHRAFDIKHLHREFIKLGLVRPAPHKDIDLLLTARRMFRFPSNKLDWVARELGVGFKVPHTGHQLWRDCLDGDDKAWGLMRRYCKHDVKMTADLYGRLRHWVPNHPNVNMLRGVRVSGCSVCGSVELDDEGVYRTQVREYPQYRCRDCGGLSRSVSADPTRTHWRNSV